MTFVDALRLTRNSSERVAACNTRRPHQALGGKTPVEFGAEHLADAEDRAAA